MNWIGGMFVAALMMIAFEIYADATMTQCVPGSFSALVRLCYAGTKQGKPAEAITERDQELVAPHKSQSKARPKQRKSGIE
jgi:hypothetical protein